MNHQSDKTGMYVDNPLELQMLFSDKLFLDENEIPAIEVYGQKSVETNQEISAGKIMPIAFFMDTEETRNAGIDDVNTLLGRMLLITQLDGEVPTMKMAEIYNLKSFSESDFNQNVKNHRKVVVFTDNWPYGNVLKQNFEILKINTTSIFIAPSVAVIMNNMEIKKDFAARLKHYFVND